MKKILLLLSSLLLINWGLEAQNFKAYQELKSDNNLTDTYKAFLKSNFKENKKLPKTDYKTELLEFYKYRYKNATLKVKYNHILLNATVDTYLESVKERIAKANGKYNLSKTKVVIARYPWPNAYSSGDGTIAFHVGMFDYIENEEQLAFILCHEFSHYLLDHSKKNFVTNFYKLNSDTFQQKVKDIEGSEFYQLSKYRALLKGKLYQERKQSRIHELEADSLGMLLYLNAGYSYKGLISALEMMGSIDKKKPKDLDLLALFALDSFTYDTQDFISMSIPKYYDEKLLKSHPDIEDRLSIVQETVGEKDTISKGEVNDDFTFVSEMLKKEIYNAHLLFYELDEVLLRALKQKGSNDIEYLNSVAVITMYRLLRGRKEHYLANLISLPNSKQDSLNNNLSRIFYGTRYGTLTQSVYQLSDSLYENSNKDKLTLYSMMWIAQMANSKGQMKALKLRYKKRYPKSRFTLPE